MSNYVTNTSRSLLSHHSQTTHPKVRIQSCSRNHLWLFWVGNDILWSENLHERLRTRLGGSSARKSAHNATAELLQGDTDVPLQTQTLQLAPPASPCMLWTAVLTSLQLLPPEPGWGSHSNHQNAFHMVPALSPWQDLRICSGCLTVAVQEVPGRLGRWAFYGRWQFLQRGESPVPRKDAKRVWAARKMESVCHSSWGPDPHVTVPLELQKFPSVPSKSGNSESLPSPITPIIPFLYMLIPLPGMLSLSSACQNPAGPGYTPLKITLKMYCRIWSFKLSHEKKNQLVFCFFLATFRGRHLARSSGEDNFLQDGRQTP